MNNRTPYFPNVLVIGKDSDYNNLLKQVLAKIGITKVIKANNYSQAWAQVEKSSPDICILDTSISQDNVGSIDFFDKFRSKSNTIPVIILTGNLDNEAYGKLRYLRPSCIINKQLTDLQIQHALDLTITRPSAFSESAPPPEKSAQEVMTSDFFFKVGDIYKSIKVNEVAFFYAENKMTYARVGSRNFPTSVQLKLLASRLHPHFLRCHKKFLLNVSFIDSVTTKEGKVKVGEETIPIGYTYRKPFLSGLNLLK